MQAEEIPNSLSRPLPASTSTRLRGRPRKPAIDVGTDVVRARGRLAQKAYRKRKDARLSALQAKCEGLESVVASMTNEFVEFSERLTNAGRADENTVRDVEGVLGRLLKLGQEAALVSEEPPEKLETNSRGRDETALLQPGSSSVLADQVQSQSAFTTPWIEPSPTTPKAFALSQTRSHPYQQSIEAGINMSHAKPFDPYANSLWQPRNISDTNTSIIPYIMAGRDSFASRLYYQTINHAVRSIQGEAPWEMAANLFRFKLLYTSKEAILGVLAGLLERLLLSTNQIKGRWVPQQDLDKDDAVKAAILEIVGKENKKDYLSTWEVERYLTGKWGLGVDSNAVRVPLPGGEDAPEYLTAAFSSTDSGQNTALSKGEYRKYRFAPTVIPGFFQPDQIILNAEPLLDLLRAECVSIGEGPRWHRASIDRSVVTFVQKSTYPSDVARRIGIENSTPEDAGPV